MIVLFLTGMVAMIMMRTLHADFRRYNQLDLNEEAEETGNLSSDGGSFIQQKEQQINRLIRMEISPR